MQTFWNVYMKRDSDGCQNVIREWAESRQIAIIRVKAHMLPKGWRITGCEEAQAQEDAA